jgi:hypothetical protein
MITKYIRHILSLNTDLMARIPISRFFPIDAKMGTSFPFCVIQRTGIQASGTKDGMCEDNVYVSLKIVDDDYTNSVEIADEIRNWLEGHRFSDDTINIKRITLNGCNETIDNNGFIQQLNFIVNCMS